ncbi:MAG: TIGR01777 family oxidoreductase [Gemmatimonadetes bacterium]|nr:TIGR01777 family oxidoreductase [Gemmatimonadota bacterium]
MRIGVTGASGFVGRRLTADLQAAGHEVRRIGRGSDADIRWDPARGEIDAARCAGIEAFVHLAGANVGERWTPEQKRAIRESRVDGTALIARTAAALQPRPRALICASAVGIYGNAGDAVLDELSPTGSDFLSEVGRAWEAAATPAPEAGIRTVHLRFGIILSRRGGALAKMVPAFLLGGGGRLGSGSQWMSWLSMDDAVAMIQFALARADLAGAMNAVAPEPVTNTEFTETLARVLRRPALFPVPDFALNLMFGEMAQATLLASQRVVPRALLAAGYSFRHASLESALRAAVNE